MTEHVVTAGLRTIGCIRAEGRDFKAWSEPEREPIGVFSTYEAAARAIYDRDVKFRHKMAMEVDTN